MGLMRLIFTLAITMAIALAITTTLSTDNKVQKINTSDTFVHHDNTKLIPSKRLSRFLAEDAKNPRAADHCHKDDQKCEIVYGHPGNHTACCNNKCMDLSEDTHNCGLCKHKCKFTHSCCRGECVNLAFDKRHCGKCGNKCLTGEYCVYGLCNYA